jgi:hypothetical protein
MKYVLLVLLFVPAMFFAMEDKKNSRASILRDYDQVRMSIYRLQDDGRISQEQAQELKKATNLSLPEKDSRLLTELTKTMEEEAPKAIYFKRPPVSITLSADQSTELKDLVVQYKKLG